MTDKRAYRCGPIVKKAQRKNMDRFFVWSNAAQNIVSCTFFQSINHVYFRHNGPYDRKTDRIEKFKNRKDIRTHKKLQSVFVFISNALGQEAVHILPPCNPLPLTNGTLFTPLVICFAFVIVASKRSFTGPRTSTYTATLLFITTFVSISIQKAYQIVSCTNNRNIDKRIGSKTQSSLRVQLCASSRS